jgi:mannose-6-phosphate isomerase-like protein (cupin superfamily)
MERLTPQYALAQLTDKGDQPFLALLRHGSLEIEIYKPDQVDLQTPHTRDELYVVISGSGYFVNGEARHPFQAGEVLFVPAGAEHRFEHFTDDFSTWVFFYGPEGGEKDCTIRP